MNKTLFRAKKIVSRDGSGWKLDIDLMFDGREYCMTEIPITVGEEDVQRLCPGADPGSGDRFEDVVCIDGPDGFFSAFGAELTDEVPDLLCDVYQGHRWRGRFLDTEGDEVVAEALLTEDFEAAVAKVLRGFGCFWMEVEMGTTRFNRDWTVSSDDFRTVFSNLRPGMEPLGAMQAESVLRSLMPMDIFSDREEFDGTVTRSGNSLVVKVTDQCRRMGLDVGDGAHMVMSVNTPRDNTDLRVFGAQEWTPIADPEEICHRDGCDLDLVRRFLEDFGVIGTVDPGLFKPGWLKSPYSGIFDHPSFFKGKDGRNMIVSQPYRDASSPGDAEKWARINGCTFEEHPEYSWHRPPETTLYVFRRRTRRNSRLPEVRSTREVRCPLQTTLRHGAAPSSSASRRRFRILGYGRLSRGISRRPRVYAPRGREHRRGRESRLGSHRARIPPAAVFAGAGPKGAVPMITDVKGDLRAIRMRLDPWEGDDGRVRYYYDNWPRYLSMEQRDRYMSEHGVWIDASRPGIKVYFDKDGWLHVDGCLDAGLRGFIVDKMRGWCTWALNEYERAHPRYVDCSESLMGLMLSAHARPLKPGFWQLSAGGVSVNLDDLQMSHYRTFGAVRYDTLEGRYVFDTGYPRLDLVLGRLCGENGLFGSDMSAGVRDRRIRRVDGCDGRARVAAAS